jgi:ABC-type taurine transport system substrate-binding protein
LLIHVQLKQPLREGCPNPKISWIPVLNASLPRNKKVLERIVLGRWGEVSVDVSPIVVRKDVSEIEPKVMQDIFANSRAVVGES